MAKWTDLPTELKTHIVKMSDTRERMLSGPFLGVPDHIDRSSVLALRQADSELQAPVDPYLWETVEFTGRSLASAKLFLSALAPLHASLVREIDFFHLILPKKLTGIEEFAETCANILSLTTGVDKLSLGGPFSFVKELLPHLTPATLSNIRRLRIDGDSFILFFQDPLLSAAQAAEILRHFPNLLSLELANLSQRGAPLLAQRIQSLASLRSIVFEYGLMGFGEVDFDRDEWQGALQKVDFGESNEMGSNFWCSILLHHSETITELGMPPLGVKPGGQLPPFPTRAVQRLTLRSLGDPTPLLLAFKSSPLQHLIVGVREMQGNPSVALKGITEAVLHHRATLRRVSVILLPPRLDPNGVLAVKKLSRTCKELGVKLEDNCEEEEEEEDEEEEEEEETKTERKNRSRWAPSRPLRCSFVVARRVESAEVASSAEMAAFLRSLTGPIFFCHPNITIYLVTPSSGASADLDPRLLLDDDRLPPCSFASRNSLLASFALPSSTRPSELPSRPNSPTNMSQARLFGALGAAGIGGAILYNRGKPSPSTGIKSEKAPSNTLSSATPSNSDGTNASALPVHTGATGNSSAKDAKWTSAKLSGSDSGAKAKFEEGVGKTRTGEDARGRRGGESSSG
ncbi:hypothetical protein BCR35DRAFT_314480 [Leucosporidium creatinivorum]|uniref:Uncharacterized protein n=1 Tax=Leucosporidium creatinivorum TaxID=106004 RepID=A0A1Y2EZ84_9BASI|nr:hypothetical protein BCR35DRAFT_314480 [Leucosporidium creatinivorum]